MRLCLIIIVALFGLAGISHALTTEAIGLRDGPDSDKRSRALSPVWRMKCPDAERLVGLRIHRDDRIAGVEVICATVRLGPEGLRWTSAPRLLPPLPEPEPPPVTIIRGNEARSEGTILTADSNGIVRRRGSRAVMISIERPVEEPVHHEAEAPEGLPGRVAFRSTRRSTDLICEQGQFVAGIRTGSEQRRRSGRVSALQLICSDGTTNAQMLVGDWPASTETVRKTSKRRKAKAVAVDRTGLAVQRIECGRSAANPHDGEAANAVFGTMDEGRITTIGLSCARSIDDSPGVSLAYATFRALMNDAGRAVSWTKRFDGPTWFDGSPVGVCEDGSGDPACIQSSADRYCAEVAGYARANRYDVGQFSETAVFSNGQHCSRRACRSFAAITCAL